MQEPATDKVSSGVQSAKSKLGSLEKTQEASVARRLRLGQLLRFFRALQTSRVLHNSIVHAKT